jgi:DNA-binding NarL/FixJ family response regulator
VIILITFDLDEYVFEALGPGPAASWSRTPSRSSCCTGCERWPVETRCSPERDATADRGVREPESSDAPPEYSAPLTERSGSSHSSVRGSATSEIAARLVMSPATAKTHVSRAMVKCRLATGHSSS